jgi:hypothetical protein
MLVNEAHELAATDSKWTRAQEKAYTKAARMSDRIRLLKSKLPPFLVENASIYGILSDGVHNLTEEQCLKYFDVVRNGIELMLEQKIAGDEIQQRLTEGSRAVAELKTALSRTSDSKT